MPLLLHPTLNTLSNPLDLALKIYPEPDHFSHLHISCPGPGYHHLCPRSLPWLPTCSPCLCSHPLHSTDNTAARVTPLTHTSDWGHPHSCSELSGSSHVTQSKPKSCPWPEKPYVICLPLPSIDLSSCTLPVTHCSPATRASLLSLNIPGSDPPPGLDSAIPSARSLCCSSSGKHTAFPSLAPGLNSDVTVSGKPFQTNFSKAVLPPPPWHFPFPFLALVFPIFTLKINHNLNNLQYFSQSRKSLYY